MDLSLTFVSSVLLNCHLCSYSCCKVSVSIASPEFCLFVNKKLACSLVKIQPYIRSVVVYLSMYLGLRGKNAVGTFLTFYKFKQPALRFSSELVVLKLSCMFVGVTEVCSSPKLSTCWSCSIFSSLEVRQSLAKMILFPTFITLNSIPIYTCS